MLKKLSFPYFCIIILIIQLCLPTTFLNYSHNLLSPNTTLETDINIKKAFNISEVSETSTNIPAFPLEEHQINGNYTPFWLQQQLAASVFLNNDVIMKKSLENTLNTKLLAHGLNKTDESLLNELIQTLLEKGIIIGNDKTGYRSNVDSAFLSVWADDYLSIKTNIENTIDDTKQLTSLMTNLALSCKSIKKYPNEANHPVLRAISQMNKEKRTTLIKFIYAQKDENLKLFKTSLLDAIILMVDNQLKDAFAKLDEEIKEEWSTLTNDITPQLQNQWAEKIRLKNIAVIKNILGENWMDLHAPNVKGTIYEISPEGQDVAGGLGRVQQYHPVAMNRLGADVCYIEPWYRYSKLLGGIETNYGPDGNVAVPVKGLIESTPYDTFTINISGENIEVNIFKVINNRGIPVLLIRDKNNKFVRELYKYKEYKDEQVINPHDPDMLEFSEFFTKASWELIKREELKKKQDQGIKWNQPVINSNDAQSLLTPLWRMVNMVNIINQLNANRDANGATLTKEKRKELEDNLDFLKKLTMLATTHTYKNRGFIGEYNDYWKRKFLQMGIPENLHWLFIAQGRHGKMNLTSVGLRCAEIAKAVASIHAYEVSEYDPNVDLKGISNGDDIWVSTKSLRTIVTDLSKTLWTNIKKIINPMNLSIQQVIQVKIEAKKRVKESQIIALTNQIKQLKEQQKKDENIDYSERIDYLTEQLKAFKKFNIKNKVFSYLGRFVPEKGGMDRAFTEENIRAMLKAGVNVIIDGNVQPYESSINMGKAMADIMKKLNNEGHPGVLIFKDKFSLEEHIDMLPAVDMQINDSDRHTGACEITETNAMANYAIQFSPPFIEGLIGKQGAPINYENKTGNTVYPKDSSPQAYLAAFLKIAEMKAEELAKYQINSNQLAQVLDARLTGSSYLRYINEKITSASQWITDFLKTVQRPTHEVSIKEIQVEVKSGESTYVHNVNNQYFNVQKGDNLLVRYFVNLNNVPKEMTVASLILPTGTKIPMTLTAKDNELAIFEATIQPNQQGKILFSLSSGITELMGNSGISVANHAPKNLYNGTKFYSYELIKQANQTKELVVKFAKENFPKNATINYGQINIDTGWINVSSKELILKNDNYQTNIPLPENAATIAFVVNDSTYNNYALNYYINLKDKKTIDTTIGLLSKTNWKRISTIISIAA